MVNAMSVEIILKENGPAVIRNSGTLTDNEGNLTIKDEVIALCRCGASKKKPFCDGSHMKIDFKAEAGAIKIDDKE